MKNNKQMEELIKKEVVKNFTISTVFYSRYGFSEKLLELSSEHKNKKILFLSLDDNERGFDEKTLEKLGVYKKLDSKEQLFDFINGFEYDKAQTLVIVKDISQFDESELKDLVYQSKLNNLNIIFGFLLMGDSQIQNVAQRQSVLIEMVDNALLEDELSFRILKSRNISRIIN